MSPPSSFVHPPPKTASFLCSFPRPGILLVLINRQHKANSLTVEANYELASIFDWFDLEPACLVAIISGVGKTFCAGADLKEWMQSQQKGVRLNLPHDGFGGLSARNGKKPIIAAVNGPAHGGGCEMVINCDMVVASSTATFCLPEVKRGVVALAGALPRIIKTLGRQRAAELALTGRVVMAREFEQWGVCNLVVEPGQSVVEEALKYAMMIADASPDAIIVTKEGMKLGWEAPSIEEARSVFQTECLHRLYKGSNIQEGLDAYTQKREPKWEMSRL